jgi:hypothetical protein
MILFEILLTTAISYPLLYGQNFVFLSLVYGSFEFRTVNIWNIVFFAYVWLEFVFVLPLTLACVALKYRFGLLIDQLR